MKRLLLVALLTGVFVAGQEPSLKIDQIMTAQELERTGISALSTQQREALNRWLVSYTLRILSMAQKIGQQKEQSSQPRVAVSGCPTAIESAISGDFNGWDGETIFKLENGQIWQQAEYAYTYSYSYHPDVTIYQTSSGCRMKVADEDETIIVKRLK